MTPGQGGKLASKELGKRLLLVLGGVAAALVLLELGVRASYLVKPLVMPEEQLRRADTTVPPPFTGSCVDQAGVPLGGLVRSSLNPSIIFELKPEVDTCFSWYGTRVRTNAEGQRAHRSYLRPKPDGTVRVVGIGDSMMFGYGVEVEATYGFLLEGMLSEALGRQFEFVNTAVGGYNTVNEVAVLEETGLSYDPDLVILHWCGNDFSAPAFLKLPERGPLVRSSALLGWLRSRWASSRTLLSAVVGRDGWADDDLAAIDERLSDEEIEAQVPSRYHGLFGRAAVEAALARLAALARERSLPVLVLVGSRRMDEPMFARHGLPTLAIDVGLEGRVSPNDAHLGAAGHRLFAAAIATEIARLGLLGLTPGSLSGEDEVAELMSTSVAQTDSDLIDSLEARAHTKDTTVVSELSRPDLPWSGTGVRFLRVPRRDGLAVRVVSPPRQPLWLTLRFHDDPGRNGIVKVGGETIAVIRPDGGSPSCWSSRCFPVASLAPQTEVEITVTSTGRRMFRVASMALHCARRRYGIGGNPFLPWITSGPLTIEPGASVELPLKRRRQAECELRVALSVTPAQRLDVVVGGVTTQLPRALPTGLPPRVSEVIPFPTGAEVPVRLVCVGDAPCVVESVVVAAPGE